MSMPISRRPMAAALGREPGGPRRATALDLRRSSLRLLRTLRPERLMITAVLLLGVTSVSLAVLGPRLLGRATDVIVTGVLGAKLWPGVTKAQAIAHLRATGQGRVADMVAILDVIPGRGVDFAQLGRILLLALVVYVLSASFGIMQGRLTVRVVQRLVFRLREQVETKLSRLPLSYFDQQPRGELLSRATNDMDNLAQTLQQTLSQLVAGVLTIIGVAAVMFWLSPLLALAALATVPLSVVGTIMIGKRAQPRFAGQWKMTGKLNGHIEEMYAGHSLVKVFGLQDQAAETFREHNRDLYARSFKAQFISGIVAPAMLFLVNINYVLVAVVGGLQVASGQISLGTVQSFLQYTRQLGQPVNQVATMTNLLQSAIASAERIFVLLDAPEQEPDPVPSQRPARIRGRVTFEDVSFRYRPDQPLIESLTLTAEPGQTVAIVGPTGAGKTTLVNLMMRFYDITSGRITLDGVDITAMTREELRRNIGMVLQDTWLFGGTIAANIAYGAPQADREEIVAAARAVGVDRFVQTLAKGYDTVLDEEASNVSAGEVQLITIARAFLAEPPILILDEATSSVDSRTEMLIQRATSTLRSGRTSFIIAHRLSTIRDADLILVMESGRIVEQGAHDQLLAANGPYARLYAAQFAAALTGAA